MKVKPALRCLLLELLIFLLDLAGWQVGWSSAFV
jgi:hypothetical protein